MAVDEKLARHLNITQTSQPPPQTTTVPDDNKRPTGQQEEVEETRGDGDPLNDFRQVSDNEWEVDKPNGDKTRIVIDEGGVRVIGGNDLNPDMYLAKGTYKHDAQIAQLNAIKEGVFYNIGYWEDLAQFWHFRKDAQDLNDTQRQYIDLWEEYTPRTWDEPIEQVPEEWQDLLTEATSEATQYAQQPSGTKPSFTFTQSNYSTASDFERITDAEWRYTNPKNGEQYEIVVTGEGVLLRNEYYQPIPEDASNIDRYKLNEANKGTFVLLRRGSVGFDIQMAQLKGIEQGIFHSLGYWENRAKQYFSTQDKAQLTDAEQQYVDEWLAFSPQEAKGYDTDWLETAQQEAEPADETTEGEEPIGTEAGEPQEEIDPSTIDVPLPSPDQKHAKEELVQVSPNEWHFMKAEGGYARIIIESGGVRILDGNALNPDMYFAKGTYKYDAQIAQLNALGDTFRNIGEWEDLAQFYHFYKNREGLTQAQLDDIALWEQFSPMTRAPVPAPEPSPDAFLEGATDRLAQQGQEMDRQAHDLSQEKLNVLLPDAKLVYLGDLQGQELAEAEAFNQELWRQYEEKRQTIVTSYPDDWEKKLERIQSLEQQVVFVKRQEQSLAGLGVAIDRGVAVTEEQFTDITQAPTMELYPYITATGGFDINKARADGVAEDVLQKLGFTLEQIKQADNYNQIADFIDPSTGTVDMLGALAADDAAANRAALRELGITDEDITRTEQLKALKDRGFVDAEGNVDVVAAVAAGVPDIYLINLGVVDQPTYYDIAALQGYFNADGTINLEKIVAENDADALVSARALGVTDEMIDSTRDMLTFKEAHINVGGQWFDKASMEQWAQADPELYQAFYEGDQVQYDTIIAEREAEMTGFLFHNTQLPDGTWMQNTDIARIQKSDPILGMMLTSMGYDAYQQGFNIKYKDLGDGQFVERKWWDALPPEEQAKVNAVGLKAYNAQKVAEYQQQLDDYNQWLQSEDGLRWQVANASALYGTGFEAYDTIGELQAKLSAIEALKPNIVDLKTRLASGALSPEEAEKVTAQIEEMSALALVRDKRIDELKAELNLAPPAQRIGIEEELAKLEYERYWAEDFAYKGKTERLVEALNKTGGMQYVDSLRWLLMAYDPKIGQYNKHRVATGELAEFMKANPELEELAEQAATELWYTNPIGKPALSKDAFVSNFLVARGIDEKSEQAKFYKDIAGLEYARMYGAGQYVQSDLINVGTYAFAPMRALHPEYEWSDIRTSEWVVGGVQVALIAVAPALGAVRGATTGAVSRLAGFGSKAVQGTATIAFAGVTAMEWDNMEPSQRALMLGLNVLTMGALLGKPALVGIKTTIRQLRGATSGEVAFAYEKLAKAVATGTEAQIKASALELEGLGYVGVQRGVAGSSKMIQQAKYFAQNARTIAQNRGKILNTELTPELEQVYGKLNELVAEARYLKSYKKDMAKLADAQKGKAGDVDVPIRPQAQSEKMIQDLLWVERDYIPKGLMQNIKFKGSNVVADGVEMSIVDYSAQLRNSIGTMVRSEGWKAALDTYGGKLLSAYSPQGIKLALQEAEFIKAQLPARIAAQVKGKQLQADIAKQVIKEGGIPYDVPSTYVLENGMTVKEAIRELANLDKPKLTIQYGGQVVEIMPRTLEGLKLKYPLYVRPSFLQKVLDEQMGMIKGYGETGQGGVYKALLKKSKGWEVKAKYPEKNVYRQIKDQLIALGDEAQAGKRITLTPQQVAQYENVFVEIGVPARWTKGISKQGATQLIPVEGASGRSIAANLVKSIINSVETKGWVRTIQIFGEGLTQSVYPQAIEMAVLEDSGTEGGWGAYIPDIPDITQPSGGVSIGGAVSVDVDSRVATIQKNIEVLAQTKIIWEQDHPLFRNMGAIPSELVNSGRLAELTEGKAAVADEVELTVIPTIEPIPSEEPAPSVLTEVTPITKPLIAPATQPQVTPSPIIKPATIPTTIPITVPDTALQTIAVPTTRTMVVAQPEVQPQQQPQLNIVPAPVPYSQQVPRPEQIPEPLPEPTPRTIPPPVGTPLPADIPTPTGGRLPPPVLFGDEDVERWKRDGFPAGTITWKHGMFWKVIPPPYDIERPINMKEPPKGVTKLATGKGSAYATVQVIGGLPPKDVKVDLGWADVYISATSEDDVTINFKSGGEKTVIGSSIPSPTRGITVQTRPDLRGAGTDFVEQGTESKGGMGKATAIATRGSSMSGRSAPSGIRPQTGVKRQSMLTLSEELEVNRPERDDTRPVAKRPPMRRRRQLSDYEEYYLGRRLPDPDIGGRW